jgi:hypothetical protein
MKAIRRSAERAGDCSLARFNSWMAHVLALATVCIWEKVTGYKFQVTGLKISYPEY